jgi:hypothetical protein
MDRERSIGTLYVDHQIIAKEVNWPLLSGLLSMHKSLRLAVSLYNLIEISAATDNAQKVSRAELIDSLNPVWVLERLVVEKKRGAKLRMGILLPQTASTVFRFCGAPLDSPFLSFRFEGAFGYERAVMA